MSFLQKVQMLNKVQQTIQMKRSTTPTTPESTQKTTRSRMISLTSQSRKNSRLFSPQVMMQDRVQRELKFCKLPSEPTPDGQLGTTDQGLLSETDSQTRRKKDTEDHSSAQQQQQFLNHLNYLSK